MSGGRRRFSFRATLGPETGAPRGCGAPPRRPIGAARRRRRSRPGLPGTASRAAAVGPPRSAGSRGCGSGTRSATRPSPHELIKFTPSAPKRFNRGPCQPLRRRHGGEVLGVDLQQIRWSGRAGSPAAWPRVAGLMSMKATVRSSSSTRCDGISPATILQNRQSGSRSLMAASLTGARRRSARGRGRWPPPASPPRR